MCHAIIEVKYIGQPELDMVKPKDADSMNQRLQQLKENSNIERIRVFALTETFIKETTWRSV